MDGLRMDRQSEVFRHATEADWAGVNLDECEIYPGDDPRPITAPEPFEQAGWDADRDGPKSVADAKATLAARIADPAAPDDELVAGAYDDLED